MNEVILLIKDDGSSHEVLCGLQSIGTKEFYQAHAVDYHPELKFILADYFDYEDESLVKYEGELYRVLRTYRAGQELELTVQRASAEEAELYG